MRTSVGIVAPLVCWCISTIACAQPGDGGLRLHVIDADAKQPLLCARADAMGRVFVGGRDALFVHEPNGRGGYQPRKMIFRFPPNSHVNDIEIRGLDLFILTQTALYVIPDGVRKRENVQPKKLLWGVPRADARQGFRAFAWGPEGDLYVAVGCEPMQYWTFYSESDGGKTPHRGTGAVYRCKPDGSGLRLVAGGMRQVDGMAQDRFWNLFTADSDDATTRLLHVTPHAFFAASAEASALRPMIAGKRDARLAALAYFDETSLPAKYRGYLLGAMGDDLAQLSIEPRGASFDATMFAFVKGKKPNAVSIGRGGRIFAVMNQSDLVMVTSKDDPAGHPFEPYEPSEATPDKLWRELGDPSWHRRCRAHIELTRRGGDLLVQANKKLLAIKADDPALHHLIWLAAMSRKGSLHLLSLVDHVEPKVRVQAIRAITEFAEQVRDETLFTKALLDEDAHVQHAALSAYFAPKVVWNAAIHTAIERGAAVSRDSYLRQTAAQLLARKLTRKEIESMCGRFDAELRLAGVLAIGIRLTTPEAKLIRDHLPLRKFKDESAYVIEYADGKVDLREHRRIGLFTMAEHWKADKHTEDEYLSLKMLRKMQDDRDMRVRAAARSYVEALEGK